MKRRDVEHSVPLLGRYCYIEINDLHAVVLGQVPSEDVYKEPVRGHQSDRSAQSFRRAWLGAGICHVLGLALLAIIAFRQHTVPQLDLADIPTMQVSLQTPVVTEPAVVSASEVVAKKEPETKKSAMQTVKTEAAPPKKVEHKKALWHRTKDKPEPVHPPVSNMPESHQSLALAINTPHESAVSAPTTHGTLSHPLSVSAQALRCQVPAPVYPAKAKWLKQEGTVIVKLMLGEQGELLNESVAKSSGIDALDDAALHAIAGAHCQPYRENGIASTVVTLQPVTFRLRS